MAQIELENTKSNSLKYTTWSFVFISRIVLTKKGKPFEVVFQLDVMHD
jgi:hypothetical protein